MPAAEAEAGKKARHITSASTSASILRVDFIVKNHSFFCPSCDDYKKVTTSQRTVTLL